MSGEKLDLRQIGLGIYDAFLCQLTSASLQIWLFFIPTSLSSLLTQIFAHHDHFHVYALFGNCKITLGNPTSSSLCQSSNYRKVLQFDLEEEEPTKQKSSTHRLLSSLKWSHLNVYKQMILFLVFVKHCAATYHA